MSVPYPRPMSVSFIRLPEARTSSIAAAARGRAARSFRAGELIANESEPQTIADGARTLSLGKRNWEILRTGLQDILEVSEDGIKAGVRMLFELANLKVEPTGALALAALMEDPARFNAQTSVCCIVSGGNVDPDVYRLLI